MKLTVQTRLHWDRFVLTKLRNALDDKVRLIFSCFNSHER